MIENFEERRKLVIDIETISTDRSVEGVRCQPLQARSCAWRFL